MKFRGVLVLALLLGACSGLSALTPMALEHAEMRWNTVKPRSYRLVVEMSGDRVEKGQFEVRVDNGVVVSLKRNGKEVPAAGGQDYSMDGLFKMLWQEMELAKKPELFGAPAGYSAYPMARFDETSARLIHYRRTVGGTNNTIDIAVVTFESLADSQGRIAAGNEAAA